MFEIRKIEMAVPRRNFSARLSASIDRMETNSSLKFGRGVVNNPAVERQTDLYGTRFAVDMPITGSNGNTEIVPGWIIDPDASTPRLTSAYIRSRKKIKKVSDQDSRAILNDILKSVGEGATLLRKAIAAPEQSVQGRRIRALFRTGSCCAHCGCARTGIARRCGWRSYARAHSA